MTGIRTLVVIGTDCIGSYKSNYNTIMTMTAPADRYIIFNLYFSFHYHFNALFFLQNADHYELQMYLIVKTENEIFLFIEKRPKF